VKQQREVSRNIDSEESPPGVVATAVPNGLATAVGTGAHRIDLERTRRIEHVRRRRLRPGGIPAETTLVGRDEAVVALRPRIMSNRLVTLTGPGGVGKTAVAQSVAWDLQRSGGELRDLVVCWVSLAGIGTGRARATAVDTDLDIDRAVAAALGIENYGEGDVDDVLSRHFAETHGQTLLVLDNCEHVVGSAAEFVGWLLDETADHPDRLRILCTSREVLGCRGEWVEQVKTLSYPDTDDDLHRSQWPAVEMFRNCVSAFGYPSAVTDDQLPTIAEIVRAVDGLPLAILVLASEARRNSPAEILDRIRQVSTRRRRTTGREGVERRLAGRGLVVPEGLRLAFAASTRAADWTPQLDRVLQRLTVFDGGWTLAAAAEICADFDNLTDNVPAAPEHALDCSIRPSDVAALVRALVDKSLVEVDTMITPTRYRMLQPTRWIALERLLARASEEEELLRARHVRYYFLLAGDLGRRWCGPEEVEVLRQVQQELGNFRSAMAEGCLSRELAPLAATIAMCIAATRIWHREGNLNEGKNWVLRTAEAVKELPEAELILAGLYVAVGWFALSQGEVEESARYLEECLSAFPSRDPEVLPAHVLQFLASHLMTVNHDPHSIEIMQLSRRRQSEYSHAVVEAIDQFPVHFRELVTVFASLGKSGEEEAALFASFAAAFVGDRDTALALTEERLEQAAIVGAPSMIAWARMARALALTKYGDLAEAKRLAEQAVVELIELGDGWGTVWGKHLTISVRAEELRRRVQARGTPNQQDRDDALHLAMAVGAVRKLREVSNVRLGRVSQFLAW
jgi:predicted ATPase